jgi:hypothetical protein
MLRVHVDQRSGSDKLLPTIGAIKIDARNDGQRRRPWWLTV